MPQSDPHGPTWTWAEVVVRGIGWEDCRPPTRWCRGLHFFPREYASPAFHPSLIPNESAQVPYEKHVAGRAGTPANSFFFCIYNLRRVPSNDAGWAGDMRYPS